MKSCPVSLQLWTLHAECAKDFAGTMEQVARMGYAGVELAGYGNLDVKRAKAAIRAAGLVVTGMHVRPEVLQEGSLPAVIDEALELETHHVVCAWWPPSRFVSVAACQQLGEHLNRLGAMLRSFGLQLSYHNHDGEMKILQGRTVLDWVLGAAEPRNLAVELDVYWARVGGVPPDAYLRRLGERCRLVHLKDERELGSGPVDFTAVFAAIDSVGAAEALIVEADKYTSTPLETAQASLDRLRHWGRI